MTQVGIAVFGGGRMGQLHIRHLVAISNVHIRWIVDIPDVHPHLEEFIKQHHPTQTTHLASVEQMEMVMSDNSVQAVVICTPPSQHEHIIKAALTAGKTVFCEKPVARTSDAVRSCYQLAKEKGKVLYCGFQRHQDADFLEVYNKIHQEDIGKIRLIKITSRDGTTHNSPEFLRNSGGIFLDSCVHDFDAACWLAGETPKSLVAYGHAHEDFFIECGDVDIASIMLKFPSGTIATIDNSRIGAEYGYDQRVEVLGSKGMLRLENPRVGKVEHWNVRGTLLSSMTHDGTKRYTDAYRREIEHFVDIVTGKAECKMTPESIITVSVLVELAQESLKTGKTVTVPCVTL